MATLSGNKIKNTYQSLVKFSDNGNITTSAKQLTDGFGNNSPLFVSTTQVGIGVTPESGLNLHVFGDAKIGSNLTVIGNLVVEGSTTTVGTDTLTVKDPLIVLANNNTSTDAVDIGFYGKYHPSDTTLYTGLFREALTGKYRLFRGLQDEPTTTVNTSGTGYTKADLVVGNLNATNIEASGDISTAVGTISGNITGGTISGSRGTFSENLIVSGTGTFSGDVNVNSNFIVTTGTPTSAEPNGSHVIAKIDSSAGNDTGGLEIHTGDNNGDEPALLHTNYNGDEAFRISSLGHIISTGSASFVGQVTIPETPTADTHAASKGYVDSGLAAQDTLAEILAIGNTSGGTDIAITAGDKITNFTSTGIDDNSTSTVLTIDNTNRALFSGDVSLGANLIGNTNATGDLTILGSLFVGDYGVNDDPDYLYADNNIFRIGYYSNAKQFEVNNSDFKVTATHKVGIGTNDPQTLLEVSNENSGLNPIIRLNNVDSSLSDGQNLGSIEFYNDHTNLTTGNIGMFYSTDGTIAKEMRFNFGSPYGDIFKINVNEINAIKRFTITGSGTTPRVTLVNNAGEAALTYSLSSQDNGDFGIFQGNRDLLIIDSNGDVGIGTDNPQTKLHLQDEDNALFFTLESSNTTTHKNIAIKYQNYSTGTDFWWTGMNGAGDNMNNFVFNYSQNFDNTILTLEPTGNATFAGQVSVTGEASNGGTINIGDTAAYRGILSYTGASTTTLSIANSYDTATARIDFNLRTAGTPITALRLEGSGNATFAGNVQVGSTAGYTTISQGAFFTKGGGDMFTANLLAGAAVSPMFKLQRNDVEKYNIGLDGNDNLAFINASGDAKMSIDSSGNVKIGTSTTGTPAVNADDLVIDKGASESGITLMSTAAASIRFGDAANTSIGSLEYNHNSDYMRFSTNNAERMRIDSSGFIKFSKTASTATAVASINHASNNFLYINGGSGGASFGDDSQSTRMIAFDSDFLRFDTTSLERMRITSGGKVGIGTNNPVGAGLTVASSNNGKGVEIQPSTGSLQYVLAYDRTVGASGYIPLAISGSDLQFLTDAGTERMRITSGGQIEIRNGSTVAGQLKASGADNDLAINGKRGQVIFEIADIAKMTLDSNQLYPEVDNTMKLGLANQRWSIVYAVSGVNTSDETLKENIQECDLGIDFINSLKPKSYNFKDLKEDNDAYGKKRYGIIAQDLLQTELKDAVFGKKDGEYGVSYNDLIAPMVKAIQELKAEVDSLKQQCKCKN